MEKLTFTTDDNEQLEFFILEETRINGINYILVSESEDETEEETEVYILKDTSEAENNEAVYEFVEEHDELEYVSKIFTELLDDVGVEM